MKFIGQKKYNNFEGPSRLLQRTFEGIHSLNCIAFQGTKVLTKNINSSKYSVAQFKCSSIQTVVVTLRKTWEKHCCFRFEYHRYLGVSKFHLRVATGDDGGAFPPDKMTLLKYYEEIGVAEIRPMFDVPLLVISENQNRFNEVPGRLQALNERLFQPGYLRKSYHL